MSLPLQPGNTFSESLGKANFHKPHHFEYSNDLPLNCGFHKSGIGGDFRLGREASPLYSQIPKGRQPALPAWLAFDKQVLSFEAFYEEEIGESRHETSRIHHCNILFYLEDDSLQIVEAQTKNSGIPQGTIVRRHRAPRPAPFNSEYITVEDLNVGKPLLLYGRVYSITDCDKFTYNFLQKLGFKVPTPGEQPKDPYTLHREAVDGTMKPLRPYEHQDTLKQFLENEGKVLRFLCIWDDRSNMFGDKRQMQLNYFLSDEAIEIKELVGPNSGRETRGVFLKRGKLERQMSSLRLPGQITNRTILNVLGSPTRYILDNRKTGDVEQQFYTDRDLLIGNRINVHGREFLIIDCNSFTKEYYRIKYGIDDFEPLQVEQEQKLNESIISKMLPPYNGFGSEEDSLSNCFGIVPKRTCKDMTQFLLNDRHGLDGSSLRFLACLESSSGSEADRRFIISYFLADDTILVFERPEVNAGSQAGKFMERMRVKKPGQPQLSTEPIVYYRADDLYVGAIVNFNGYKFRLLDADEYAYNYMEKHPEKFSVANTRTIMMKILTVVRDNRDALSKATDLMPFTEFRKMLFNACGGAITEHEVITVARHYQRSSESNKSIYVRTLARVQEHLQRGGFQAFPRLHEQCMQADPEKQGYLPAKQIWTAFSSLKVPVTEDLLNQLFDLSGKNENGDLNYGMLIHAVNWSENRISQLQLDNLDSSEPARLDMINAAAFLEAIKEP